MSVEVTVFRGLNVLKVKKTMERNKKCISFKWGNKTKKNETMTNQRGLRCFEYIDEPCFLRWEDVVGR